MEESSLGLNESTCNLDHNYKLVPWLTWEEWDFVKVSLFSSSPSSVAKALRRISAWRSRGCLPVIIEVTASIVETQQKDPHFRAELSDGASSSEEMLAMLYNMAIMRLVNGVTEKICKQMGMSVAEAAEEIDLPRMLVDIRHEGSHQELPSLRLLRLASIKALDWLKFHYWDPQKNAIPYQSGRFANVRKEIRSKLREMAFGLKVDQSSGLSPSKVKGNSAKNYEQMVGATVHGRTKFFSLVARKAKTSKYVGSKKRINRTMKNLVRLYSFFSSDVVSVLLEFLLDASNTTNLVDAPEKIQIILSLDVAQAAFDEWKPVIIKFCKKEPELLLSLLKAVLDMIESRKAIRDDFGSEHFSLLQYDSEMQRIGVLSSLFGWLLLVLKGLKFTQHKGQGSALDAASCLPKISLIEVTRRCLHISDPGNLELLNSAMLLAEMASDCYLSGKLHKLSSLAKNHRRVAEDGASDMNANDLSHEDECIRQAAKNLELVKRHKITNANVLITQDGNIEDTNIWTIAKSWNPCPIGMLPRDVGSSGCLPVLDHGINGESKAALNSMDIEKDLGSALNPMDTMEAEKCLEIRQYSKREAGCDVQTTDDSCNKRMKQMQNYDFSELNNLNAIGTSDGLKGLLLIDGVWQKLGNQELQNIKSRIGILVTKRKS